ncbi:NAD(P)/FAD-dependent oxidoreductase [Streptomyces amakusaensis]|uniref:Flavin-containing monooxygenase n=1 Tax=Streptomyces amakusaensis TaxID=67271 RepID=A0ABW0ABU1_9ACTN
MRGTADGPVARHVRVAVIGAGFSGLGAAVRLRRGGHRDFVVLERSAGVGGTWRDNGYPGCACDVPSHLYAYSFAPGAQWWSRTFSGRQDIRLYLETVADTEGVRPHLRLRQDVRAVRWNADRLHWEITSSGGAWTADVVVCATGPLSAPSVPQVPGLDTFPGPVFHSARWDHGAELRDRRVAVIGTGASAVQIVPALAAVAAGVRLFQRTPPWVLPRLDRRVTDLERRLHQRYPVTAAVRRGLQWGMRELVGHAFTRLPGALAGYEALARAHLRRAVRDPGLRERLTPDYRIGCKRILLSSDYYPALAQPHVEVVTSALAEVRGSRLIAEDGTGAEADALVFATGFRVTDPPVARRIVGTGGRTLAEAWREGDGMRALRGTTVPGFPNLVMLLGPNTALGNTSMVLMIESQLSYLLDYLRLLEPRREGEGRAALDPLPSAFRAWNDGLDARLGRSVWNTGACVSWYLDGEGRNTTLWPGSTGRFRRAVRRVDPREYERITEAAGPEAGGAEADGAEGAEGAGGAARAAGR